MDSGGDPFKSPGVRHNGGCNMKVSIEGILGSARKINSQRQLDDGGSDKKKKEIRGDSISIGSKINSRLDSIETEYRDLQSSLTKNQIIKDGLDQLETDFRKGGAGSQTIFEEFKFQGEPALRQFVGDTVTEPVIKARGEAVGGLIEKDISTLKRLQVEFDNIVASNLVNGDKLDAITANVDTIFKGPGNLESMNRLNPDSFMRIIK